MKNTLLKMNNTLLKNIFSKNRLLKFACAAALIVSITVPASAAQWQQSSGKYWYQRDDGSYPANVWEQIDGSWYHFDGNGYMQTGWYVEYTKDPMLRVSVYYLDPSSGKMVTNAYVRDYHDQYGEMFDFYIDPNGHCADKEYPLQQQAFWAEFNYNTEHTDWNAVLNKWGRINASYYPNDVSDADLEQQVTWDNDVDDNDLERQVTWTNDIDDSYLENQSWGDQGGEY